MDHLEPLKERINEIGNYKIGVSVRDSFIDFIKTSEFHKNSSAMSVSVGDGLWDYLLFSNTHGVINKIVATDIVDNPVDKEGIEILKKLGDWEFKKIEAEKPLTFADNSFDLVFHQDVVEHVKKPYLFLSEQ